MNRSLLRSVIVTSTLFCVFRPAAAGELKGRFLVGDRPAAGVTVSALPYEAPLEEARRDARRTPPPQPLASVKTSLDGSFVLAVPAEPGKEKLFTVCAEGGGVVAALVGGVWSSSESGDLGEHVLAHGETLAGKVTDASGAALADAEVVLVPRLDAFADPEIEPALRRTTTGAEGTFRFDGASATGNVVAAEKPGLLGARRTGVKAGALQAPIVLGPGVPVTGVVRKPDRRSAAAGALVRVEGHVTTRWVETGEDGSFMIPVAPAGVVAVVADAGEDGYLEQHGVALPLAEGKALTIVLQPPSALTGRTVDAKSGRPVPRTKIEVRAAGTVRTTRSGPDGTYALRALPPQTWRLRADEPRYVPWIHASVPVRPGETRKLDIPLVLGATLSGRVTDENGQPVAGARCRLIQGGSTMWMRIRRLTRRTDSAELRTKSDGTFKATRLAPGENQILTVSHPDFEAATIGGVTLVGGATKTGLAVVLQRGAVLTGVVKDRNAQPVSGAEVLLIQTGVMGGGRGLGRIVVSPGGGPGFDRKNDTSGDDGHFTIRGVAPGEYALTVRRSGYATETVDPVKVAKGVPPGPIEVTLAPGSFIAGRVVRRSGGGAEGFMVFASSSGGTGRAGRTLTDQPTGPDGSFFIEGLRAGQSYDLQLFGPTGPAEGKRGVTAPASDVELTVAGTGRISGRAVDAQGGTPLTDFQASYQPDRGGGPIQMLMGRAGGGQPGGVGQPVNVHSEDGTFTLDEVPAGTWSVVVTATGYQAARTSGVVVEEGGSADNIEVKATRGVLVKGHVTNAQSGTPVPNASVTFAPAGSPAGRIQFMTGAAEGELTTDADGRFEAEGLAPGTHTVHVTHPDYTDATQSFEAQAEGATVEIRMTQGGVLAGTVASDTGAPVAGADVTLEQAGTGGFGPMGSSQSTLADGTGRFRFDHLGAGRYTVSASLGSHTTTPLDVVLQAGQSQENLALRLQVGITIQGTVSGLPPEQVSGTTVTASGADQYFQSTRVAGDGRFEFDNVPAGVVTLRATADDLIGSTRTVTKQVTAPEDQPILTADLVFEPGYTLSGRVTQAGQPVSGAMVFATPQGGGGRQASSRTDDSGTYTLADLQEGTYTVNAISSLTGVGSFKRTTITLTSDQTLDIVFPSAKIAGQVVDADDKAPLSDVTVTIAGRDTSAGGSPARPATTDSNGSFSFTNIEDGSYTLTASKSDYRLSQRSLTASDQGTDGLVVELSRAAGIRIRVLDGIYNVPLRGVMVRVLDTQGSPVYGPASISLDGDGRGEIPSLPPGGYTVVADASGYAPTRLDGVLVPSPTVSVALTAGGTLLIQAGPKTLGTGTASGIITSAIGQPALLSLFNLEGRVVLSQPNTTLRNVPSGSYVLSIPGTDTTKAFTVNEGAPTTVQLP